MIQWTEKVIWYNGLLDILFMSELGRKHGAWSCTESHRDTDKSFWEVSTLNVVLHILFLFSRDRLTAGQRPP